MEVRRRASLCSAGWQLGGLSETGFASQSGFPRRVPLKATGAIYLTRGN